MIVSLNPFFDRNIPLLISLLAQYQHHSRCCRFVDYGNYSGNLSQVAELLIFSILLSTQQPLIILRCQAHYSAAELGNLLSAANQVVGEGLRNTPALFILKKKTASA